MMNNIKNKLNAMILILSVILGISTLTMELFSTAYLVMLSIILCCIIFCIGVRIGLSRTLDMIMEKMVYILLAVALAALFIVSMLLLDGQNNDLKPLFVTLAISLGLLMAILSLFNKK